MWNSRNDNKARFRGKNDTVKINMHGTLGFIHENKNPIIRSSGKKPTAWHQV